MTEYKPFMTRKEASAYTGLPYSYIVKGTLDGCIPCIKSGKKYLINMSLWKEQLDEQSRKRVS